MTPRVDPHSDERGKWDVSGAWWCDCPAKNGDGVRRCRWCKIYRPLKGTPLYRERHVQRAGFMGLETKLVKIEDSNP